MRAIIAGYNVDHSLLAGLDKDQATPEVISAAYARISRSHKDVDELRQEALLEINKTRKSNQTIIFDMGHSSVAEHAVFNIDLLGISRTLTEIIQRSRLASFTEKSQRYVTFERDYVIPEELSKEPELREKYTRICELLFEEYASCIEALKSQLARANPNLEARELDTFAKEDARYILPLATKTQMGMTINARSLEVLLRRLSATPTQEAKTLRNLIYMQVYSLAPSLIRYTQAEPDEFVLEQELKELDLPPFEWSDPLPAAKLISASSNADDVILSNMLFEQGGSDPILWRAQLGAMAPDQKDKLWKRIFHNLAPWQKLPRAFEAMELEYLLQLSECSWSQLKRHRSATLIKGACDDNSPIVIPAAIKACQRERHWSELLNRVREFKARLQPQIRPYLRLNMECTQIYAKLNLRELYHFTRLRSDIQAQWEIRIVSDAMMNQVKPLAPQAASHLGGKSEYQ